jgi:nitrogen regulatory protein PII
MKKIEACIKTHKLTDVTMALHRVANLSGATVFDARGWGRGKQQNETNHPDQQSSDCEPHVGVAVFCPDPMVEAVVTAIEHAAHTGLRGDGKIYVLPADDAVRISTGERGEAAV